MTIDFARIAREITDAGPAFSGGFAVYTRDGEGGSLHTAGTSVGHFRRQGLITIPIDGRVSGAEIRRRFENYFGATS